jgi:NADP-dependent 3-hydroxy acid dehydrogenase YdfG
MTSEGARVTVVEPGYTETELQSYVPDDALRARIDDVPDEMEVLQPNDVARAIGFAVSQPPMSA